MEHYIEYQKQKPIELKIAYLLFMRQNTNVDLMPYFIKVVDPLTLADMIKKFNVQTYDMEKKADLLSYAKKNITGAFYAYQRKKYYNLLKKYGNR